MSKTPHYPKNFSPNDIEQNKSVAALGYILFLIPMIGTRNSQYAQFHANQGLLVQVLMLVIWLVVLLIPIVLVNLIAQLLNIICVVWIVLGILHAIRGEAKPLPLIGGLHIID